MLLEFQEGGDFEIKYGYRDLDNHQSAELCQCLQTNDVAVGS
jgi:hypothetical protein